MLAVNELKEDVSIVEACDALGVSRATYYRRQSPDFSLTAGAKAPSPRALSVSEREQILDTLHSDEFIDKAPYEVYATLLDRGSYLCSVSTMYRILRDEDEVRERRNQVKTTICGLRQQGNRGSVFSFMMVVGILHLQRVVL